jgi:hypothetical protein
MASRKIARKAGAKVPAKPYEPTTHEHAALEANFDRQRNGKPAPSLKVSMITDGASLSVQHVNEAVGNTLLMESLGTADLDFLNGVLGQLVNVGSKGGDVDERGLNFMLAVIRGIEPRDQLETMLAAQMAAIHNATMTFARRLNHVKTIPQQDSAERALNKLARTFAAQLEALKKYRTGEEQKVIVQNVSVNDNAQAIVGNVSTGGGDTEKK